jgi:Protein of unknown function (DUF3179)
MRDEETGSYWQQVTGAAVSGPLKGEKLSLIPQDELSFALWKKEQPNGTVLAPLPRYAAKYEKATWENEVAKLPTVIHATKGSLADRETIIGVVSREVAQAYPLSKLTPQSPVLLDMVGGEPIMVVLGPDGKSVRVFSRQINNQTLEFFGHDTPWTLLDSETNSWGFDGCALSGDMKGQCLTRIDYLKDYWFDWQHYHPHSGIFHH